MDQLNSIKSSIWKKNMHKEHVPRIHNTSREYTVPGRKAVLPDGEYQLLSSPAERCSKIKHNAGRMNSVITKVTKLGERMDVFTQELREHVRLGPKLSDTVRGKMCLGAKILQDGGLERVFRQKFNTGDDEKLSKVSQCYLSTTAGPIAGLLFVSNDRVAFCSERSIKLTTPAGKLLKVHYKVMIPLRKIKKAVESENTSKPSQKYVLLVTRDDFEFWFMGFLNHQKTLKFLQQAINQIR
ncbi:putative GEM-like protein 8 [Andrographis paniculata]|uniref:putative GEM-like protein 8 n=1 Tax=Andrographis paniculata TaxID=175694 RepID=UPI0021E9AA8E|nr:putative GEM-like protein 8 [Andrographis paniculata]